MSNFDEEFDEIIERNAEMAKVVIDSGLVSTEQINKSLKYLDKLRLRGEKPPEFLDYLLERKFIDKTKAEALRKAFERHANDIEIAQFEIPGYKLIQKIGSGGLGVVFAAKQLSMKRNVALKILHENWTSDDEFKTRFLREARVMGRLSHQNLIQVYDVGKENKNYYFCMEYIDGPTVEDKIEKEKRLEPVEALDITLQVARAINYISNYDIVHRDIKPANLMINNNGVVKLGDFGFLYMRNKKELNQDGYVIGTPDYISPEQAGGLSLDFRSDLYSLGVCLYQMLTGALPYEGSVSTVMLQHVTGDIPERTSEDYEIPKDIYNIICKMMAKSPNDRYQKVSELLDDLQYYKAAEIMKQRESIIENRQEAPLTEETEKESTEDMQDYYLVKQNKILFTCLVICLFIISFETIYLLTI